MTTTAEPRLPIVVVVEDDVDLADLYADWLLDSHRIRQASSVEGAKAIIDGDVDVVLLDRMLPGAPGDAILDWIQEQEFPARVAMITGVSPDFDVIGMGFDTYVVKPTSRQEIRNIVQMLLTRTIYDQRVQRYLELLSKKDVLEAEMNVADLDENQDYQRLTSELSEIRAELDYLLGNLDDAYFADEMQTLVGRRKGRPG